MYATTEFPNAVTRVYPNPFAERFRIDFYNSNPGDDISVAIYDLNGKQVYNQHSGRLPLGNTSVNISLTSKHINAGIYLLTFYKNGVRFKMFKLIKQK